MIGPRLRRFFHRLFRRRIHAAITYRDSTPGREGYLLISCSCGKEFYRRSGFRRDRGGL
jgi:hypothetical protein